MEKLDILVKSKKAARKLPETLIVRPKRKTNKMLIAVIIIVGVVAIGFLVTGTVCAIQNHPDSLSFICVGCVLVYVDLILLLVFKCFGMKTLDKRYLLLTTDKCKYTDDCRKTTVFHFDEIVDINHIVKTQYKGNPEYLCITLTNNRKLRELRYDNTLENIRLVQPYVAYHKKKRNINEE